MIKLLPIQETERERAAVLLSGAFVLGLSFVLFNTGASAVFLSEFSTDLLPHVYLVNATLTILGSLLYARLEARVSFFQLLHLTIGLFVVITVVLWLGLVLTGAGWIKVALMVWYRLLFVFGTIGLWETAGRLFTIQEGKRLFPLIAAGEMLAVMLGGLAAIPILQVIETHYLLLLSAITLLLYVLRLSRTLRCYQDRLEIHNRQQLDEVEPAKLLRNRYILMIFSFRVFSGIVSSILGFVFYNQARQQFATESSLGSFIGLNTSVMTLLVMIVSTFIMSRYIRRFGIRGTLPLTPFLMALGTGMLFVVFNTGVSDIGFFWLLTLVQLLEGVLFSAVTTPVISMLYQPLKPAERTWVRIQAEGKMSSIALVVSGLILFSFRLFPQISLGWYIALLMGIAALWLLLALWTTQEYAQLLKKVIGNVFLRPDLFATQSAAYSTHDFSASLGIIDQVEPRALVLAEALKNGEPSFILSALAHIEQSRETHMLDNVKQVALESSFSNVVRTAAMSTWMTLDPGGARPFLLAMADQPALRSDALRLMLRDERLKGQAEYTLMTYAHSDQIHERLTAAEAITAGTVPVQTVCVLLNDPETDVQRQAVRAAVHFPERPVVDTLTSLLDKPELRPGVILALSRMHPRVLEFLKPRLDADSSAETRKSLVEVCARMGGMDAARLLRPYLDSRDPKLRLWVLRAVNRIYDLPFTINIGALLANEWLIAVDALQLLVAWRLKDTDLLGRALLEVLDETSERILRLLALQYPRDLVLGGMMNWQKGKRVNDPQVIAYALEGLFVLLSSEHRALLFPLLEPMPNPERLKRLAADHAAGDARPVMSVLLQREWVSTWVRLCIRDHLRRNPHLNRHPDTLNLEEDSAMLTLIDKVQLLHTVSIFAHTPASVMAEVAQFLQEKIYPPDTPIIREHETGSTLFILVEGAVRVHKGSQLLSMIEAPDIFGELSVLDAFPRSASVTAQTSVKVMALDREALYQAMSAYPEIMEGVIQVLCHRIRQQNENML